MKPRRCLFLFVALAALSPGRPWAACTPNVGDGDSLQNAIDNATSDFVCIGVGTYTGPFTLPSTFTLEGEELARTILKGSSSSPVITAGATSTTIRNLTIDGNGTTGLSAGSGSSANLENVVVKDATDGLEANSATVDITNAVFDGNAGAGLKLTASDVSLDFSILSNNSTDILQYGGTLSYSTNLTYANSTSNYPTNDPPSILDQNPLFVDSGANDFHLKAGSPAIDTSDPTLDLGAYGGSNADPRPFPVAAPSAEETADFTLRLTWAANEAYDIGGYRVYFDNDVSGPPYVGVADQGNSPVDVGKVTETTLSGLSSNVVAPAAPQGVSLSPGNSALLVSWQPVTDATGYFVSWGEAGLATTAADLPNKTDVGNSTDFWLAGLTNNVHYDVAVTAYRNTTYYLAVTAYNSSSESVPANEAGKQLSDRVAGEGSALVTDYPEATAPFPILADENKCFIATAAYGSPLEVHVTMLRRFRNHFLLTNAPGRALVDLYYCLSPPLADFIRHHQIMRATVRAALVPVVAAAGWCLAPSLAPGCVAILLVVLLFSGIAVFRCRGRYERGMTK